MISAFQEDYIYMGIILLSGIILTAIGTIIFTYLLPKNIIDKFQSRINNIRR